MKSIKHSPDGLTPEQAADYPQVDRETIYRYIREGQLMAAKLGRAYRIPRRSLDLLLWSTRTRPEVSLRDYSGEEMVTFLRADQLEDEARAIAERFSGRANPRAGEPTSGTVDLG